MTGRTLTLKFLYFIVAALVSVPLLVAVLIPASCRNAPCKSLGLEGLFKGEIVVIWLPPLAVAAVLIWIIFRMHRAADPAR